eukprot:6890835-Heterocapsa_arctica.AAC.1
MLGFIVALAVTNVAVALAVILIIIVRRRKRNRTRTSLHLVNKFTQSNNLKIFSERIQTCLGPGPGPGPFSGSE